MAADILNYNLSKGANYDIDGTILRNWLYNIRENLDSITINDAGPNGTLKNASNLFCNQIRVTNIDISNAHFENVVNAENMFYNCGNLTNISNFDTANIINAYLMFGYCQNLTNIPNFDTKNIVNMNCFLTHCYNINSVPDFNTANVTDISFAFGDTNLLSAPNINTSKVVTMAGLFKSCTYLSSTENYDTSNVMNTHNMFYLCKSLNNVSFYNLGKVENASLMFYKCYNLNIVNDYNLINCKNTSYMFAECYNLKSATTDGCTPPFNLSNVTDASYMYLGCSNFYAIYNYNLINCVDASGMFRNCYNIYEGPSNLVTDNLEKMNNMFANCSGITNIYTFNTSKVNNMSYTFDNCYKLVGVENFNTDNLVSMWNTFNNCSNIKEISWNFQNLNFAQSTFENCRKLYNISGNFCNLTSGFRMFYNCINLKNIDGWNLVKLNVGEMMFMYCNKINSMNNVTFPNLYNAPLMFTHCNFSSINDLSLPNVRNAYYMFGFCQELISVNNIDAPNISIARNMFMNCIDLQSVDTFNLPNAYDLACLFDNCYSLTSISNFNTTNKVTNISHCFRNCQNLTSIPEMNLYQVTNAFATFANSINISSLNVWMPNCVELISTFDTRNTSMSIDHLALWNAVNIARMFGNYSTGYTHIDNLGILYGLGNNFRTCTPNSIYSTLDLYGVTNGQMLDLSLSELYNIGAAGFNSQQILVQGETYSNISYETKQDISSKGWLLIQMGTVCLTGDTEVQTENGLKEIKDIEVGDRIYTYNQETNRQNITEVTKTVSHLTQQIYTFTLSNGEEIKCTARHQFLVNSDHFETLDEETNEYNIMSKIDFMEARLINLEDKFVTKSGEEISITNISISDNEQNVYEINTEKGNNYMIGSDYIIVKQEVIED